MPLMLRIHRQIRRGYQHSFGSAHKTVPPMLWFVESLPESSPPCPMWSIDNVLSCLLSPRIHTIWIRWPRSCTSRHLSTNNRIIPRHARGVLYNVVGHVAGFLLGYLYTRAQTQSVHSSLLYRIDKNMSIDTTYLVAYFRIHSRHRQSHIPRLRRRSHHHHCHPSCPDDAHLQRS
jgi:hypothetical protein